jgi:Xaa-Pro aminopeptidase
MTLLYFTSSIIMITIPQRINQLRNAMQTHGVDALIIPSSDPHLSEYLPNHWQGREYFSGFTGSVATLIVTSDFAGCWIDSRYWSQAETELAGTGVTMMKAQSGAASHYIDWLCNELQAQQVVSVDGAVLGLATARSLQTSLQENQIQLNTQIDIVSMVWEQRPSLPTQVIYEHQYPFATISRQEKLTTLRQQMRDKGADWHFISTVDDIAWLLNLRGSDVSYNPVFISHALIGQDSASLFIDINKVPNDIKARLVHDQVQLQDYAQANAALANLPSNSSLLIDPKRITYGFQQAINKHVKVIEAINPTVLSKSRKTEQEAQFVRDAMEQDGAALCEFFSWFENNIGKERITEITIDEQICAARAKQAHFISPSFGTIAGYNGNGAMPHYRATPSSHATIEGNGLLLIDSGGQYLNGTTDITRVVPVGNITAAHKRDYTLVLKGMIALTLMQFPHGTYSTVLDTVARAPMWAEGINYGHGTGHGVGYFMNVHEGPQSISGAIPDANMVMEVGMITSNEPGIYRPNQWGIRIENLMLCVPSKNTEFGNFLKFETLTLCPIDTRCIDMIIMTPIEINWLNEYHQTVLERLSPRVSGDALNWLKIKTQRI